MHRLKGLEFPRVVLAGVHEGSVPPASAHGADAESEADHELRERCLLHVAMTRARDELVVLGFGRPSPLLGARTGA
jgi:superfamily I DNA/RNA helicase